MSVHQPPSTETSRLMHVRGGGVGGGACGGDSGDVNSGTTSSRRPPAGGPTSSSARTATPTAARMALASPSKRSIGRPAPCLASSHVICAKATDGTAYRLYLYDLGFFVDPQVGCVGTWLGLSACGRLR